LGSFVGLSGKTLEKAVDVVAEKIGLPGRMIQEKFLAASTFHSPRRKRLLVYSIVYQRF